ncbi:MAG: ATP-binding cassette domain-containing protein [Planctomycetota bacterium]|nr:MAG: ATP-binding cassette domain-containing protein [Planctomycetota bacterium]
MLEIYNACKTFNPRTPNAVFALQGVNLIVEPGSFVCVIGTNGSGKSTLLNAIAGTFGLDTGSVRIDGSDVTHWPEHRRASFIGRVFQNPFTGTAAGMTIAENIVLALRRGQSRGLRLALNRNLRNEIKGRVRRLNLGLEERLDDSIGTLSGGQRQALTLLMATWIKPRLLLLDEHTAALDPKSAKQIVTLSREIIERDNLTTIMVTHSMQQAVQLGDRLIMMHQGRIISDYRGEDKKRILTNELNETFEMVRRLDQLDESAAELLARSYV